jgi:hypothetical protein
VEQDGVQRFRRAVAGLVGPPAYGVVDLQGTCKKVRLLPPPNKIEREEESSTPQEED